VSFEDLVRERARDFDPAVLLALLRARFPGRAIRLVSDDSLALRPTPVEAVEFFPDEIVVRLNFGLFSSSSSLPSYHRELFQSQRVGPALESLVRCLDERLLEARVEAMRAELSPRLYGDLERVRGDFLRLAAPASPGSLQGLAAHLFPELSVSVFRGNSERFLPVDPPRLGYATLGAAALGGEARAPVPALELVLRTEESMTWQNEPWIAEASRRFEHHLLPLLEGSNVHLVVLLVDLEGSMRLRLKAEGVLGAAPLERAKPPEITVLFDRPLVARSDLSPGNLSVLETP